VFEGLAQRLLNVVRNVAKGSTPFRPLPLSNGGGLKLSNSWVMTKRNKGAKK
jgi:hypothetical protein